MNIVYLRYAVEISKTGSIKRAAENLFMAQPNLSRAIKELESSLGIVIFERTSKGMVPTADGEKLIAHAKKILLEVEETRAMFDKRKNISTFSISVPRASYIANAFSNFSRYLNGESQTEIFYFETNALRAVNNILHEDYKLAIVRFNERDEQSFTQMLEDKGLVGELITTFKMKVVFSASSMLAVSDKISVDKLNDYIELSYGDAFIPMLSVEEARERNRFSKSERRVFLSDRAAMYDLLSSNKNTFARCSALTEETLKRFDLVQKDCEEEKSLYKDFLVYKKDYRLTELDKTFITELCLSRRKHLNA